MLSLTLCPSVGSTDAVRCWLHPLPLTCPLEDEGDFFKVIKEQCLPVCTEYFPLEKFLTSASTKQYVAVSGSAIIQREQGPLEVGEKEKHFPPSVNKALAYLRSTMITGFGFLQSSFLEILDGAE